jgi:hypothetical protein
MTLLGLRNWRQFTREFEGEWPSIWRKGCRPTSAGRSVILRVLKATGASVRAVGKITLRFTVADTRGLRLRGFV